MILLDFWNAVRVWVDGAVGINPLNTCDTFIFDDL